MLARLRVVASLLLLAACRDADRVVPAPRPLRLRLAASVDAAAGRQVDLTVFYARTSGAPVTLLAQRFDVDTGTRDLSVTIDITACLHDPERAGGAGSGCPVGVKALLRDPSAGVVDSTTVGPVSIDGGGHGAAAMPPVVLTRTARVRLTSDTVRVHVGDTLTVAAAALDASGRPIAGRALAWSSGDPTVATVNAAGVVTGVGVGRTTVTVAREGQTATLAVTVPITGVQRWVDGGRIGLVGQGDVPTGFVAAVLAAPGQNPVALSYYGYERCQIGAGGWACRPLDAAQQFYGSSAGTPVGPDEAWMASYGGTVAHYVGGTLHVLASGATTDNFQSAWGTDERNVFAVGIGGLVAHFDGTRWTRTATGTGTASLHAVTGTSPTNVIAVGDSGLAMRFDGQHWTRIPAPVTPVQASFYAAWAADSTHVFATAGYGLAFMWDGAKWNRMPSPGWWEGNVVHGTSARDVYVGAAVDSQFVLFRWNGTAWSRLTNLPVSPQSLYADGTGRVFIGGGSGYVALWDGTRLTTLSHAPELYDLAVTSPTSALAVGDAIYRFDGSSWSRVASPWGAAYVGYATAVAANAPGDAFVVTELRGVYHLMHFDGAAWQLVESSPYNYATNMYDHGWYAALTPIGSGAVLLASTFYNQTTQTYRSIVRRCTIGGCGAPLVDVPDAYTRALWASSPTNVFVAAYTPGVASGYHTLRYDGRTLRRTELPANVYPYGVWGPDSATVLLSTSRGVMRYDYAANAWTPLPGQTGYVAGTWGTAFDDLYTVGCGAIGWYNGRRWTNGALGSSRCANVVRGLPSGGAIAALEGGGIAYGVGPSGTFASAAAGQLLGTRAPAVRLGGPSPVVREALREALRDARGGLPRR